MPCRHRELVVETKMGNEGSYVWSGFLRALGTGCFEHCLKAGAYTRSR